MKASIIGAGGRVGSNAAFCLQCAGIVSEIQIMDANREMADGEALDLMHGAPSLADQRIYSGCFDRSVDSDVFVITAGLRRKPDESRLDLMNRNVGLFSQIIGDIKSHGMKKDAIVLVVSNPVDILTHLATSYLGLPAGQVIGLGTMLDTARFRSLIANDLNLAPTQVKALILGEHGDSMLPVWSSATVGGLPLTEVPGCDANYQRQVFDRTKKSGAEVISRKGGAGWAVGATIAEVIHAIALDRKQLLPVSSLQTGAYGLKNVCLSVPSIVGRRGVERHLELKLWPREEQALKASAKALQAMLSKVAG